MKHKKLLAVILGLVVLVCFYYFGIHHNQFGKNVNVSDEQDFINKSSLLNRSDSNGVPSDTKNGVAPGVSIYWAKFSVSDGNDTCTLFDTNNYLMYASSFVPGGLRAPGDKQEGGTTYYNNSKVSKKEALGLMEKWCYTP